jgi:hypothetical protein
LPLLGFPFGILQCVLLPVPLTQPTASVPVLVSSPFFPRRVDSISSLSDGRALIAVLLFYMPRLVPAAVYLGEAGEVEEA